jgi:oligopeptide/dipeptide ABC transporter ATP-binding protein
MLGAAVTLLKADALRKLFPVGSGRMLHAVDGVDLALGAGESLGIVGESGSGKSTLARLVVRLLDADHGTIRFEDRDIGAIPAARFPRDPARRAIQLVFQNAGEAMNPAFSTARNIALGRGRLSLDPEASRAVGAIAAEVGLAPEHLGRRPHQLSGGQQARAGIARALISEPRLLVLDEPTASLDVSVQATVLRLIDGLRRQRGIALMFVSHDLEVVRLMCERVLVLYLGRIAEMGDVREVLAAPAHPYTQALVAATPGRGKPRALQGEPVSPIDPPAQACLFRARCSLAVDRCHRERPPLRKIGTRLVACHRAGETTAVAAVSAAVNAPGAYSPI